jgi:hypothetical protein
MRLMTKLAATRGANGALIDMAALVSLSLLVGVLFSVGGPV